MNEDAHLISAMNCAGFLRKNDKHCNATMVRALARALGALRFISSRPTQRVAGRHSPFTARNFPSAGLKIHGSLYRDFCVLFLCFVIHVVWILKMDIWKCVPVQKEIYFNVLKAYNSVSSTRLRFYVYPSVYVALWRVCDRFWDVNAS